MAEILELDRNQGKPARVPKCCSNCLAWRPKKNQMQPIFGGCARGGQTTTHYGDTQFNHYTTDLQSCSLWESNDGN